MIHAVTGFWGKLQIENGQLQQWLSLTQHCLDVAEVFAALLELPTVSRRLPTADGKPLDAIQQQRLAVIALLHDVGKANLGFQDKPFQNTKGPRAGHIKELAALFADEQLQARLAEALAAETLCAWFEPPEDTLAFLTAAWSHHGKPEVFADTQGANHKTIVGYWQADSQRDPFRAIAELLDAAKTRFPAAFSADAAPIPATPVLQHRFAGLVMLADWLGSHRQFFPLHAVDAAAHRPPDAVAQALRAVGLDARHWQSQLARHPANFNERFGFAADIKPRGLQSHLDRLPTGDADHRLLIAEAETGAGKTEAALARFLRLFAAGEVDGLYFALPTRVAARELYLRVTATIARLFPDPDDRPVAVLAVPGYVRVDNVPLAQLLPDDGTRYQDDAAQAQRERLWAAEHPKRFLAATVAVGTLDQALLSTLQTPHAHLRSVCLDRSLLVVDEVHASDPYMRRLLRGLLRHHLGIGGHALLLSATLGSRARADFTRSDAPDFAAAVAAPYPAVTDARGVLHPLPSDAAPPKPVQIELRPDWAQPAAVLPTIAAALQAGARVLVVLNTVGRAVSLQRAAEADATIAAHLFQCAGVITPHHGRYAPVDREILDEAVTAALGKQSAAGAKLLIGTQTLEQSLDIDADLLITDLCPMDVLLQRIGRLHRHAARPRPPGFATARCIVLAPAEANLETLLDTHGNPNPTAKKGGLGSVYPDMRILQLTRNLLAEKPDIEIPRDNRRLVEGATHSEKLAALTGERWDKHTLMVEGGDLAKGVRAHYVGLTEIYRLSFGDTECRFRDNEEAKTRLGLGTVRLQLNQTVTSPFGKPLHDMLIPAHLADKNATESQAVLIDESRCAILFAHGDNRYRYSRHGLEKLDD